MCNNISQSHQSTQHVDHSQQSGCHVFRIIESYFLIGPSNTSNIHSVGSWFVAYLFTCPPPFIFPTGFTQAPLLINNLFTPLTFVDLFQKNSIHLSSKLVPGSNLTSFALSLTESSRSWRGLLGCRKLNLEIKEMFRSDHQAIGNRYSATISTQPDLIFVIFSPQMYFWAQFFST